MEFIVARYTQANVTNLAYHDILAVFSQPEPRQAATDPAGIRASAAGGGPRRLLWVHQAYEQHCDVQRRSARDPRPHAVSGTQCQTDLKSVRRNF